jgi:hypothetical protein
MEKEPLYYDIWVMDYLNNYFEKMEQKFYAGKISHKQFGKSLEKLEAWGDHYVSQWGYEYYDPDFEEYEEDE